MQKEAAGTSVCASRRYDSNDLDMFKAVLDETVAELSASGSALASEQQIKLTRVRLASCIFMLADRGERDPSRLKRQAKLLLLGDDAGPVLALRSGREHRLQ